MASNKVLYESRQEEKESSRMQARLTKRKRKASRV